MLKNGDLLQYHENNIVLSLYRPFTKKWLYYDNDLNERTRLYSNGWNNNNELIFTSGRGARNPFSLLATNLIPSMDANEKGQGFYKDGLNTPGTLINNDSNITTEAEKKFQLSKDDLFDYVYGILNSYEYQDRYQNDLRKDLARIPNVRDKEKYVETGKKLINLHINYENVPIYDKVNIQYSGDPDYRVEKMKFSKKRSAEGKLEKDRSTIIFNDSIIISNIPEKAYEYIVNGKSAIEWIMDQYQVKTDKKSGITDDPNDYSDDPKYIFNLLLRIINVSVQTVDLINQLPPLEIEE